MRDNHQMPGGTALPRREKAAYISSNIATAFSWGYITSYFMMFCTDAVGISAFAFSALLLVSRLFDGVTDPSPGGGGTAPGSRCPPFRWRPPPACCST